MPSPRGPWAIPGLAALLAILYAAFTTQNYMYADDSIFFVYMVKKEAYLNAHHLIMIALHGLNRLLGFTGPLDLPNTNAMFKAYVAVGSGVALYLVGTLTRRWFGSLRAAIVAMLATAATYGWWCYSIVADVYVPATAFTLLAVDQADRALGSASARGRYARLAAAALATLAASLHHQAHALMFVPVAIVLLAAPRARPWRDRLATSAYYVVLTGALGLVTYYAAYAFLPHVEPTFHRFVTGYAAWMVRPSWDVLSPMTPIYGLLGIVRTFVFPEYVMHFESVYDRAHRAFPTKFLYDERYLLRTMGDGTVVALMVIEALILAFLAFVFVRAVMHAFRRPPSAPGWWMVLLSVVVQGAFFVSWEPTSNEFWIWLMPSLAVLVTGLVVSDAARGWRAHLAWALPALLLVANFPVVTRYMVREHCIVRVNKDFLQHLGPNDLVVSASYNQWNALTFLEGPQARVFDFLDRQNPYPDSTLVRELAETRARGGRVVLDPLAWMPDDTERQHFAFTYGAGRDSVDRNLLRLEADCRALGLPLLGVYRDGGGVVSFAPTRFTGYVLPVDQRLEPILSH